MGTMLVAVEIEDWTKRNSWLRRDRSAGFPCHATGPELTGKVAG